MRMERSHWRYFHTLIMTPTSVSSVGGRTLEEPFEGLAQVRATRSVRIDFEEEDLELALVTSLNTLLVEAGIRGLVLGRFRLVRDNSHWQGEAWGEPWRERTWGRGAHRVVFLRPKVCTKG